MYILYFTAGIVAAIWIFYFVIFLLADNNILRSSLSTTDSLIKADMVYYLPKAAIQLNATAKIIILTELDAVTGLPGKTSGKLAELSVVPEISLLPDTDYLFTLNHIGNCFMNDEFKLTVGATGLLESITATTEDRLGAVLSTAGDMPAKIFPVQPLIAEQAPEPSKRFTTETKTFSKSFFVTPESLSKGNEIYTWQINLEGTVTKMEDVNASFTAMYNYARTKASLSTDNVATIISKHAEEAKQKSKKFITGLLTRPLVTVWLEITPLSKNARNTTSASVTIQIPDTARLINIPVKRTLFVKSVNTPKFSNGMLVENYLNRPSTFEGFISIPINLAKAFASIPAQLFNFKIQHEYQNEIASLSMQKRINDLKKQAGEPAKKP
jgi:hypothetical protein